MSPETFEKLGAFYLGRPIDSDSGETLEEPLLYDSRDLVTHAVCLGMTGSGKTGLCIGLLEEAAMDGVPALVIDPKGDIANLMLTFPELRPEDFRPWVEEAEARRKGISPDELAEAEATKWRKGLAEWGQDGERIRRLRETADFAIYTPGSDSGIPISILSSFSAPPEAVRDEADLLASRIETAATGVLSLLGVDADPITSREHILLANLLGAAWSEGRDLDLAALIAAVQSPPMETIGALPLEAFYPAKERFELAMRLNNLLAAPTFQGWLRGEPLDVDRMLYTEEGRPRVAIVSLAHLGDTERMFFVSLLLEEALGWMRGRSGSSSLRALLYMDEIYGYLPPVANPPSKRPLLTMLKQARAFGFGVVLATQNPVDLDYKALSNTGTWLVGRLQTERDQKRVLDALEGAEGAPPRAELERLIAGLEKRAFLLHNVHEKGPVVFRTRWVMSYLRGPMTRREIRLLTAEREARLRGAGAPGAGSSASASAAQAAPPPVPSRPLLPPEVAQRFLPPRVVGEDVAVWRPEAWGEAEVSFVDRRREVEYREEIRWRVALPSSGDPDWRDAEEVDRDPTMEPSDPDAAWDPVPTAASTEKALRRWKKDLSEVLYRDRRLELLEADDLEMVSRPGESERDFRIRLADRAREVRDQESDELREKAEKKLETLAGRVRRAEERVEKEKEQASQSRVSAVVELGSSVLGAFLGRKKLSVTNVRRASRAVKGFGRSAKEGADVERAEEKLEDLQDDVLEMEQELESDLAALAERWDPLRLELKKVEVAPRRQDVAVREVALLWSPWRRVGDGRVEPA